MGNTYLVPVETAIVGSFNLTEIKTIFIKKVLIAVQMCAWRTVTDLHNVFGPPGLKYVCYQNDPERRRLLPNFTVSDTQEQSKNRARTVHEQHA